MVPYQCLSVRLLHIHVGRYYHSADCLFTLTLWKPSTPTVMKYGNVNCKYGSVNCMILGGVHDIALIKNFGRAVLKFMICGRIVIAKS